MRHLALAAFLALSSTMPVAAQLFGSRGLDTRFCEQPAVRQTVAYIDDMMMVDGRTEWAVKLSDKLRATLAPGERVTVVRISPSSGQSSELWSGCWPAYSDAALADIRKQNYLFQKNPLTSLSEQQTYFLQGFGGALTTIYNTGKQQLAEVRFSAAHPHPKQSVRALASDDGRFANSKITIRAIIYSDFAENSDLASVFQKSDTPPEFGQKLGSYLRRGVIYGFGIGDDVFDSPGFNESAKTFWGTALRSMAATLAGIGADLNVPNTLPIHSYNFTVNLTLNGQKLDGRLSLLTNADGDLVDSWLGISRLAPVALNGSFVCKSADLDAACRLDATTLGGVATTSPSEALAMSGTVKAGINGKLGVRGSSALFDINTQAGE